MTPTDNDEPDNGPGEYPLSLDALLEILSNQERRYLLEYLIDETEVTASPKDAISYITRQITLQRGEQPNTEDIQVSLQHHHLPKLANAGLIEYDMRSETIRYHGNDQLEELYELVSEFDAE